MGLKPQVLFNLAGTFQTCQEENLMLCISSRLTSVSRSFLMPTAELLNGYGVTMRETSGVGAVSHIGSKLGQTVTGSVERQVPEN
jgi:hypothetical protein